MKARPRPPAPARPLSGRRLAAAQRVLLAWYTQERRDLPWRTTREAYRVWVSEVMLQQTTVDSVRPYYAGFLRRFPTLAALAAAGEEQVLAAWAGLGYYRRARNLWRAARLVVERHGGRFPRQPAEARALPGVGRYTAGAVLSIAYGQPLPVVDGNVRRVLARLHGLEGPRWSREAPYWPLATQMLETRQPGDWNQALMELGATVCSPQAPRCTACPWSRSCRARAVGAPERFPPPVPRRPSRAVEVAAAVIERRGRLLLVKRQGALLDGWWELPQTQLDQAGLPDLQDELRRRHGLDVTLGAALASARHSITFRRIRAQAYQARLATSTRLDPARAAWVSPQALRRLPLSTLSRKLLRGLPGSIGATLVEAAR